MKKKLTRSDFAGLRQHYPVLSTEEMRRYVGGLTSEGYWDNTDSLFAFNNSYATDFGVAPFSSSYYGGDDDVIGGYTLPDIIIYGNQGGGYGFGGYYAGSDDFNDWWNDGWGSSYGYGGDDGEHHRGAIINENWACMFNCMNYINDSKTAEEYYEMYVAKTGHENTVAAGGLYNTLRNEALAACGFEFEEVNTISSDAGYRYILVIDKGGGMSHAVIATGMVRNNKIMTYDPSTRTGMEIEIQKILNIYKVKK